MPHPEKCTYPPIKTHYCIKTHSSTFATTGPSLTKQSHAKECDINQIMLKWQKTGMIDHRNVYQGQYGDFTNTPDDYHESMNAVISANEMFESLPAKIRLRFGNDPGQFLDFVGDPENADEMIKLGLATARQIDDPVIDTQEPPKPLKTAPTAPQDPPKTGSKT